MTKQPLVHACQLCGRPGAVSYGRWRLKTGEFVESFKCPKEKRFQCVELALEKQRIDDKEKREKDTIRRRKEGKVRDP